MNPMKLNKKAGAFLSKYNLFENDEIQQIQLQHRLELVEAFGAEEGMRILEIGCGQGDTTAALADAVGESGKVTAIDIASSDYGAPMTLGEATDRIKESVLGERITFHFKIDFKTFESNEMFDVAVLSHSSWYFRSPDDLLSYFQKLRQMAKAICVAEWDLDFTQMAQRPHFCAASILALYSNFVHNDGNIQNLFHKTEIQDLLQKAGFQIAKSDIVDASYLQDGRWEKSYANSIRGKFVSAPPLIQTYVNSYYELMNLSNENEQSLNSFVLCAR